MMDVLVRVVLTKPVWLMGVFLAQGVTTVAAILGSLSCAVSSAADALAA